MCFSLILPSRWCFESCISSLHLWSSDKLSLTLDTASAARFSRQWKSALGTLWGQCGDRAVSWLSVALC